MDANDEEDGKDEERKLLVVKEEEEEAEEDEEEKEEDKRSILLLWTGTVVRDKNGLSCKGILHIRLSAVAMVDEININK